MTEYKYLVYYPKTGASQFPCFTVVASSYEEAGLKCFENYLVEIEVFTAPKIDLMVVNYDSYYARLVTLIRDEENGAYCYVVEKKPLYSVWPPAESELSSYISSQDFMENEVSNETDAVEKWFWKNRSKFDSPRNYNVFIKNHKTGVTNKFTFKYVLKPEFQFINKEEYYVE